MVSLTSGGRLHRPRTARLCQNLVVSEAVKAEVCVVCFVHVEDHEGGKWRAEIGVAVQRAMAHAMLA